MQERDDKVRWSISTDGAWFPKSSLPAMEKAAEEFAKKGIKLEVVEEKTTDKEKVRVRITGGETGIDLSSYWKRVEEIKNESINGQSGVKVDSA